MVTRVTNLVVSRLANEPLLPLLLARYGADAAAHLEGLRQRAVAKGVPAGFAGLAATARDYESAAAAAMARLRSAADSGGLDAAELAAANDVITGAERRWLHQPGLPGRPWYRSLYAATDPDSGYAAWMLPALRHAIESGDSGAVAEAEARYIEVFQSLRGDLERLDDLAGPD
jgi:N-acetylated-alpha-linked acidic dipeptidase